MLINDTYELYGTVYIIFNVQISQNCFEFDFKIRIKQIRFEATARYLQLEFDRLFPSFHFDELPCQNPLNKPTALKIRHGILGEAVFGEASRRSGSNGILR